jgi:predicted N-acyltransferase
MLKVIEIQEIDDASWAALVKDSSVATWFQTSEAYHFFDSLSFLETFCMAVENNGQLKGVVVGYVQKDGGRMKQFFSRRAIISGGPLLANDITDEELTMLLKALKANLKRKTIYIEMRNFNDYSCWRTVFEQCGFGYEAHYDVWVDTTSLDIVNGKLDRNRKRNIKKALENGLVIENEPSEKDLTRFYEMLKELYQSKVKMPLCPYEFFSKLRLLPSSCFFIAKNVEGVLLGGLVCVALEDRGVYAWYACGEDQTYRSLSPSVMVNYAGICYAAEHGFPRFDFMGAGKPDDGGYGVRDFKLKFGGELVEHGRYKYICTPLLFKIGKLCVKIMQKA